MPKISLNVMKTIRGGGPGGGGGGGGGAKV